MNTFSKGINKSNNENDLILFSLKNKNIFAENEINESSIKSNHHFNNNNKSYDNRKENKFPLTNSILREKIKDSKIKNIRKINENNEQFLSIYKLLNINPKRIIKIKEKNDKVENYNNKNINSRNYYSSNLDEQNTIFDTKILPKKISVGLQTHMNEISKTIISDSLRKKIKLNIQKNNNRLIKDNFLQREDIKSYRNRNSLGKTITITNIIKAKSFKTIEKENSKENKNKVERDDYNNYINFPEIKEKQKTNYKKNQLKGTNILKTINLGDFIFLPKKRHFVNRISNINHLVRNRSNVENFNYMKIEENKESMSLRELFRNLVLLHPNKKNNKKIKPELRKKQILEYINKNNGRSEKQINLKINSNLLSIDNFVKNKNKSNLKFKRNRKKIFVEGLKFSSNDKYSKSIGKQIEKDENFYNNILKSFSRANERINKNKIRMENCKHSLINVQTMIDLNHKSNKK